jgi:hypothetical protein
VEFLAPPFRVMSCVGELQTRREYLPLRKRHADEAAMATFCVVLPEHLQTELDFYAEKDMKMAVVSTSVGRLAPPSSMSRHRQVRSWMGCPIIQRR